MKRENQMNNTYLRATDIIIFQAIVHFLASFPLPIGAKMTDQGDAEIRVITEDFVNVFISSNCKSFVSEKKFPKSLTLSSLRGKLELISGGSALSMRITAFDKNDKKVCDLDGGDDSLLGSYPVDSGMRLHVEDLSRTKDEFEDLDKVEKFELSKEEYSKRDNTVQSFLKRNKLGKYNEEEMRRIEEEKAKVEKEEEEACQGIKAGERCEVRVPGNMPRRGGVKFVGKVHFKPGEKLYL